MFAGSKLDVWEFEQWWKALLNKSETLEKQVGSRPGGARTLLPEPFHPQHADDGSVRPQRAAATVSRSPKREGACTACEELKVKALADAYFSRVKSAQRPHRKQACEVVCTSATIESQNIARKQGRGCGFGSLAVGAVWRSGLRLPCSRAGGEGPGAAAARLREHLRENLQTSGRAWRPSDQVRRAPHPRSRRHADLDGGATRTALPPSIPISPGTAAVADSVHLELHCA